MQIYYYTRTKRSEVIAQELAQKYGVSCSQITDDRDWSGVLNFLKGGAMASGKKVLNAIYNPPQPNKKIIIVFPVWAGSMPPAVRDFVNNNNAFDIIAIPTSLGTKLKDRSYFTEVIELIGKEISSTEIKIK